MDFDALRKLIIRIHRAYDEGTIGANLPTNPPDSGELFAPPIAVPKRFERFIPSLVYINDKGEAVYPCPKTTMKVRSPWGTFRPGFFIPISSYGLLASYCRYWFDVNNRKLYIECDGVPDTRYIDLVMMASKKFGIRVELKTGKMYCSRDVRRIADAVLDITSRGKLVVHWTPAMHLPMAALYMLYSEGRDLIGTKVLLSEVLPYGNRMRNTAKYASDYMCAHGDDVACMASKVLHKTLYKFFIYRQTGTPYTLPT